MHYNIKIHIFLFSKTFKESEAIWEKCFCKKKLAEIEKQEFILPFSKYFIVSEWYDLLYHLTSCCLVTAGGVAFVHKESVLTANLKKKNLPWILFKKQFVNHSYENPRADTRYETAKPVHSTSSVIHLYIQHRAQMHKSSFTKKTHCGKLLWNKKEKGNSACLLW